jgi:hypothetical protein
MSHVLGVRIDVYCNYQCCNTRGKFVIVSLRYHVQLCLHVYLESFHNSKKISIYVLLPRFILYNIKCIKKIGSHWIFRQTLKGIKKPISILSYL